MPELSVGDMVHYLGHSKYGIQNLDGVVIKTFGIKEKWAIVKYEDGTEIKVLQRNLQLIMRGYSTTVEIER